jgi:hypothetical protein
MLKLFTSFNVHFIPDLVSKETRDYKMWDNSHWVFILFCSVDCPPPKKEKKISRLSSPPPQKKHTRSMDPPPPLEVLDTFTNGIICVSFSWYDTFGPLCDAVIIGHTHYPPPTLVINCDHLATLPLKLYNVSFYSRLTWGISDFSLLPEENFSPSIWS